MGPLKIMVMRLYFTSCLAMTKKNPRNEDGSLGLGKLYENGLGVKVDLDSGLSIYRNECEEGSEWACLEEARLERSR